MRRFALIGLGLLLATAVEAWMVSRPLTPGDSRMGWSWSPWGIGTLWGPGPDDAEPSLDRPFDWEQPGPEIAGAGLSLSLDLAGGARPNPVGLDWSPSATGVMPEPAGTISHITWNGTAFSDSRGVAIDMVGTVPQVPTGPWYPNGFSGSAKAGAGPFSASNYYATHAANDAFDFATNAPRTQCVIFNPATAVVHPLLMAGQWNSNGWYAYFNGAGVVVFGMGTTFVSGASNVVFNGANVVCAWYNGTNGYVKSNLAATVSGALTDVGADTGHASTIGIYANGSSNPNPGTIYEVLVVNRAISEDEAGPSNPRSSLIRLPSQPAKQSPFRATPLRRSSRQLRARSTTLLQGLLQ